jgi:cell division protease FtsH
MSRSENSIARRLRRLVRSPWAMLALLVALAGSAGLIAALRARTPDPRTMSYSELLGALDARKVESIVIHPGERVDGTMRRAGKREGETFTVVYPAANSDPLLERATGSGARVTFLSPEEAAQGSRLAGFAFSALMLLGLGVVVFLQLRSSSGAMDVTRGGSRSGSFGEVAGQAGAVAELKELVEFLKHPARFQRVGARIPKGVLLVGPPGTGKTLLARAVAGEAGVPFFAISGSQITGFIVGLGAHRIRNVFRMARKRGGVIFIDEVDVLGGRRGRAQGHNEDDRTLNQLLVEMDGFAGREGVVVLAATNREEDLDPALKRPGRFDRSIVVGLPSVDDREQILKLHVAHRGVPLAADVDLRRLARLMPQASGADLANLVNEAAIAAARADSTAVNWLHFELARDRIMLGKEREGFRATDEEWRTVAWHEAGHALLGVLCCPEDGLHKVTIQPRGRAMGVAHFSPDGDRHLHSRRYLEGVIVKCLGGRAAEEIVFGPDAITSGAGSDLQQVTHVAKSMVYQLGMGGATGLVVYDGTPGSLSAETVAKMDREVIAIIDRLYERARALLAEYRPALDALALALLEHETLDGADAVRVMEAAGLRRAERFSGLTPPGARAALEAGAASRAAAEGRAVTA